MKTESQEFDSIANYIPAYTGNGDEVINRLKHTCTYDLINRIDNDMLHKLGKVTTDDLVEEYLKDTDNISKLVGWNFMEYDSEEEQDYEEALSWREICDWDDERN